MKNVILLSIILFTSPALFSQSNVDYKNHYEITILDIDNEGTAKIAIGHLRKISNSKRCDFDKNNNILSIQTNTKMTEFYLTTELNNSNHTLLTYTIIKED
tara:strand:- start:50 stop:352 length:303 start_codon:yes stop_codon:yes gene_type:complete